MTFELKLLKSFELERVDGPDGRTYRTPEGNEYQSVTTVVSKFGDKTALTEWKERVGAEEAARVTRLATSRGTRVHNMLEKHVLNEDAGTSSQPPINVEMFRQVAAYLDEHADVIYGPELRMYSDKLKLAGTTDLVCRLHGVTTIVDYKTSTYHKKEEWVQNYFLQASAYAAMLYERYNMFAPQFCVLMATEQEGLQVFIKQTTPHLKKLQDFLKSIGHC